eukprot:NODE_5815_length_1732_cov_4.636137.p1 GENE.NODE_5815_length_1732_cov_4.636137~~NODE_5815_length_1732_cov_4.636137.p1  ORF type:complete len:501 (+),score=76.66 NODE_5815_length_1732_cov_4.636137:182-1684(+)
MAAAAQELLWLPQMRSLSFHIRSKPGHRFLALILGFGQGCCLCFFLGSGSYYSRLYGNSQLFIYLCASLYLPPLSVTICNMLFGVSAERRLGARRVYRMRLYGNAILIIVLFLVLARYSADGPVGGSAGLYCFAMTFGISAAILFSAVASLLGPQNQNAVPLLVLAQTAAGVYSYVIAQVLKFSPGCGPELVTAYWLIAGGTILATILVLFGCDCCGVLDSAYEFQSALSVRCASSTTTLRFDVSNREIPESYNTDAASMGLSFILPVSPCGTSPASILHANVDRTMVESPFFPEQDAARRQSLCSSAGSRSIGFPLVCWVAAACQTLAIAMNMSLTPLAMQVAHGDYVLAQNLIFTKLLSDFVGRSVYLVLPKPVNGVQGWDCRSVGCQSTLLWLIEVARFVMWLSVYLWSQRVRSPFDDALSRKNTLLWAVWLPLISTGAMSSSCCFVVASTAARPEQKVAVNRLMTASIYAGFSVGVVTAMCSSCGNFSAGAPSPYR